MLPFRYKLGFFEISRSESFMKNGSQELDGMGFSLLKVGPNNDRYKWSYPPEV